MYAHSAFSFYEPFICWALWGVTDQDLQIMELALETLHLLLSFINVLIRSSSQHTSQIRPQRQNLRESKNRYKHFVYLLDAHFWLLIFQKFTSNSWRWIKVLGWSSSGSFKNSNQKRGKGVRKTSKESKQKTNKKQQSKMVNKTWQSG